MKPKGLAKSLLGTSTLTGAVLGIVASTATAANWTGATNQDWNTLTNWDADPNAANDFVNIAVGNFPIITANPTFTPIDIFIGTGGNTGRLDHRAGTLATGDGNWMFVGQGGTSVGTYNLADTSGSGGTLTGFALGSGSLNVGGATDNGRLTLGDGGTSLGTINMNTSGTLNANLAGLGLLVGTNGGDGVINLDNGTINTSVAWFGDNNAGSTGTLNMSGGTLTSTGDLQFGRGGGTGVLAMTGGTISVGGEMQISRDGPATATQSGGTVSSSSFFVIGRSGTGTYNLSGGTVNASTTSGFTVMGSFAGANGTLNVSGTGTFNSPTGGMVIGESGTGTLTVSGGGVVNIGTQGYQLGANASGVGTINLNGGTLQGGSVFEGAGTGTFNFNGGTLQATAASPTFMTGLTAANVQSGGAVIDSNGFAITIAQALLDGGGGGGLTKTGLGTLTLSSAANTYTGPTLVSNGTLATDLTGSFGPGNVTVADLAGATLLLGNGSSIADTATLFFGDAGTITLNNATSDTVFGITQTDDSQSIGAGTFTAAQLNSFFGVTSFGGTGSLTVVPEPAVTLLGGLGLLGILRRRRAS
jgi:fibronectin-binding autotransporter adhesin